MGSSVSRLTTLQQRVLTAFFERERSFVLTGGGALVGFHLGHRETSDLDLFTRDPTAMERARLALKEVAASLGATHEVLRESPTFARALLRLADDAVVVDLVADTVFQVAPQKMEVDGVVVDRPEEILTNKLTALVGRQEERDLVDVFALERSGLRVEDYLEAAFQKDGGCTPGTLAWLLESFPLPPPERLPSSISLDALAEWRDELVSRLRRAAFPGEAPR